jgi:hypothetical protein
MLGSEGHSAVLNINALARQGQVGDMKKLNHAQGSSEASVIMIGLGREIAQKPSEK